MAAIIWSDISLIAAELSDTPGAAQTILLAHVNGSGINVANFGGEDTIKTRLARIYLAAHLATMFKRAGTGGGIASQSEGGVSQSYYNAWANPTLLTTTSYGQMFKLLLLGTPARAGMLV
jgi:Protein of unknown function (DUF4054)